MVIDFFETQAKQPGASIHVGYFYVRYSDSANLTVLHCLEVLVKQAVEKHTSCSEAAHELYAEHARLKTRPTEAELLSLLRRFRINFRSAYYFLEGLDEAPSGLQYSLVKTLSSLEAKLFITSRHLKVVQERFPDAHCFEIVPQDGDIEQYINKKIENTTNLHKILRCVSHVEREEIIKTIKDRCDGM